MEISAFELYMLSVLDNTNFLLAVLFVGCGIVAVYGGLTYMEYTSTSYRDEIRKQEIPRRLRIAKVATIIAFIVSIFIVLLPSKRTVAAMYVLPAVINSDFVQELPSEVTDLARAYVQNLIHEYKEDDEDEENAGK